MHGRLLLAAGLALAWAAPAAPAQTVDVTVAPDRAAEPVVLTGAQLYHWSVPANQTVRLPLMDTAECGEAGEGGGDPTEDGAAALTGFYDTSDCPHNNYADADVDTSTLAAPGGAPTGSILLYRWDAATRRFVQAPVQVDEVFTRYLNNAASGFSVYSGEDQHTTYAYDREGFRWTGDGPADDPCQAQPVSPVAVDPIPGLDSNDEVAFMARDAGPRAPVGAKLPDGIQSVFEVRLVDTYANPLSRWLYLMRAGPKGPKPAFTAANGYVNYERSPDADRYAFSESSYDNYGNAAEGVHCDAEGNVVRNADGTPKLAKRRPLDTAWITTKRYRYRYDGRWLMTKIQISDDGDQGTSYGPDLVDRWKARAFAQDPGSETPCCGYEEEDTNWGGSSILLGEKAGPVRAIRETWGADSGTNVIRRETFYRDAMYQKTWLRVHVIPPLDGIYAQWDFNAGRVTRFNNAHNPEGVPVDGVNDDAFGNIDDPCNPAYDTNSTSETDQQIRAGYRSLGLCGGFPYHQSIDLSDPTFADANAALGWSQVSGPYGTIVDRITTTPGEMPAGGAVQALAAVPYYRDDSCFDDGTGSDPGPKVRLRSANEPATTADGRPRRCWTAADGLPPGDDTFYQGSIGTHGVHLLFLVDTDNARQTVPLTEIVQDWRMVMLPGDPGNVGERYGRSLEKPLAVEAYPNMTRFTTGLSLVP